MHATMGDVFHIPQPGFSPVVLVAGFYTTPWDDAADGDRDPPAGCRLVESDQISPATEKPRWTKKEDLMRWTLMNADKIGKNG